MCLIINSSSARSKKINDVRFINWQWANCRANPGQLPHLSQGHRESYIIQTQGQFGVLLRVPLSTLIVIINTFLPWLKKPKKHMRRTSGLWFQPGEWNAWWTSCWIVSLPEGRRWLSWCPWPNTLSPPHVRLGRSDRASSRWWAWKPAKPATIVSAPRSEKRQRHFQKLVNGTETAATTT